MNKRLQIAIFLAAPGLIFLGLVAWLYTPGLVLNKRFTSNQYEQRHMNHLAQEKSPYLQQHAGNPVDWYPWGEEAFEKARREQKPIFLSIGYSTCHWCHVMEHESFENLAIAEILNQNFVAIKVDREERPDVDRVYMTYVQAATGSGGWPMSVFLTPDLKPFFGGTYFPPDDRYGRPGFKRLLLGIAEAWRTDRKRVIDTAGEHTKALQQFAGGSMGSGPQPGAEYLDAAFRRFEGSFDSERGGFGSAPKFPRPAVFHFLLRYYARTGSKPALEMTLTTLRAMAAGGMHDHLGGGFHRYSVDPNWHVPHFEKMLYDQAQLAITYTEAYQITGDAFYAETARDILEYVLRDMRSPQDGFFSAEDADSLFQLGKPEHGEGAFYVWKAEEIEKVLGVEDAKVFDFHYGVEANGNVPPEWDQQGEFHGRNILIERHPPAATDAALRNRLAAMRQKLFMARSARPRPHLDDKILTAWNGLMISAFARAGSALGEPRYSAAAVAAATFLHGKMRTPDGSLLRRYRAGDAAIPGFAEDYAYLIQGLLDLYEDGLDSQWLKWAVELQEKQDALFWDKKEGGYFSTTGKDPTILVQMREDYDGAEPSPNSVAALNLQRLAQMAGRDGWRQQADKTLAVFSERLGKAPESLPQMCGALDFSLAKHKQIVLAGDDRAAMLRLVHQRYLPNKVVLSAEDAPFLKDAAGAKHGPATAYVCENFVCKLPTKDLGKLAQLLAE